MKTLITTVALATLVATPVFAQTRHAPPQARTQVQNQQSHSAKWDVYVDGKYIGSDPDAFIRSQLMSDPAQGGSATAGASGE